MWLLTGPRVGPVSECHLSRKRPVRPSDRQFVTRNFRSAQIAGGLYRHHHARGITVGTLDITLIGIDTLGGRGVHRAGGAARGACWACARDDYTETAITDEGKRGCRSGLRGRVGGAYGSNECWHRYHRAIACVGGRRGCHLDGYRGCGRCRCRGVVSADDAVCGRQRGD